MKMDSFKFLPYLLWSGPFLLVMGLSAGVVSSQWTSIPLAIIAVGAIVSAGGLLWLLWQTPGFWNRRSTQVSTNAIVATLAVLVILGLVNYLAVRYLPRLDLTENRQFSLAPQTQQILRALNQPIRVWVFLKPGDPLSVPTRSLLEEYRRQSGQFNFEIIDPQAQPILAQKFGVTSFGDVFLERGDRRQRVQQISSFVPLSENRLTNGLEQIIRDRKPQIFFLEGHGELPLQREPLGISQTVLTLQEKGYAVDRLNLSERSQIPPETDVLVISGPRQALFEGEVMAIQDYLNRGGSVLLLLDPDTKPGLDKFLKDWGIDLDNRLVINASQQQLFGFVTPVISQYGNHPITDDFGNRFTTFPGARRLEVKPVTGVEQVPLLLTGSQYWAEADPKNPDLQFTPEKGDVQGPFILGVALTRGVTTTPAAVPAVSATPAPSPTPPASPSPLPSATPAPSPTPPASPSPLPNATPAPSPTAEARLVVIGNSTFISNQVVGQQPFNADLFLNTIGWLSREQDQFLSIRPKEASNRRIVLTLFQASAIGWSALVILPLTGFGAAAVIWWRRR